MARFRARRTFHLISYLREGTRKPLPSRDWDEPRLSRELEECWATLHRHCCDQSSRLRLRRLIHRLTDSDAGVQESALAELELATQLIRVGARVVFLQESQTRTADLECHLGRGRFFVEITAMVGSMTRRRLPVRGKGGIEEEAEAMDWSASLTHRILARIQQKAKQLADYADPVILSISIPRGDLQGGKRCRRNVIWMDLKPLAGSVTVLLTSLRHLSAVRISLWDVEPLPSKATTRLVNVEVVERAKLQEGHPRVRLFIQNPTAATPLSERQAEACLQTL